MSEKRFTLFGLDNETIKDDVTKECYWVNEYVQRKKLVDLLNEQQEQLDVYKEAILTMLGLLADKGIIFSGVKDE